MNPKRSLRAVEPDEAPPTPATLTEAVRVGSSRDVLSAMRRLLAEKLERGEVSSNSLASTSKELRELDRLIRAEDAERAEEEVKRRANQHRRRTFDATAI